MSDILWGSILGPVFFINDLESGIECILSNTIHRQHQDEWCSCYNSRDLDKFKEWVQLVCVKRVALGLRQSQVQVQTGRELLESSPFEKDLRFSVDKKLNMSQHGILAAQVNCIPDCIRREVASRVRKVIVLIFSALMRHPGLRALAQGRCGAFGEGSQRLIEGRSTFPVMKI